MRAGHLQLIDHEHSGLLRQHRHTSYAGLAFVLILMTLLLAAVSIVTMAAEPAVNPQSGSIGLTGTVRGAPPSQAAIIAQPRSGDRTTANPVTVTGSCPRGTYVTVLRNNVAAGTAPCADDGTFSLVVDLFDGTNILVARVSDALGQFGPDSRAVSITLAAPVTVAAPGGVQGRQLFLTADTSVKAASPDQPISHQARIVGGFGPYEVVWEWGDGATTNQRQLSEGIIGASHTYKRAGVYPVIVRVTDSTGNTAILQLLSVVNGPAEPVGGSSAGGEMPGNLMVAWPMLVIASLMVIAFWFGELRQNRKLHRASLASY